VNTPNDANCPDDGVFCNGAEFCDAGSGCASKGDPCPAATTCDEGGKTCVPTACTTDAECDDGAFCNGAETCVAGACQAGSDPCSGLLCDEPADVCVPAAPTFGTHLDLRYFGPSRVGGIGPFVISYNVTAGDLQAERAVLILPGDGFLFQGFDALSGGLIGYVYLDLNNDGSTDLTIAILRDPTNPTAVAGADLNGDGQLQPSEPRIVITSGSIVINIIAPYGDGNPGSLINPVNLRVTIEIMPGIIVPVRPGIFTLRFKATSVDPDTGGADDLAGHPNLSLFLTRDLQILPALAVAPLLSRTGLAACIVILLAVAWLAFTRGAHGGSTKRLLRWAGRFSLFWLTILGLLGYCISVGCVDSGKTGSPGVCSVDSQCASGEICRGTVCVTGCREDYSNTGCGAGKICRSGECVRACAGDGDCEAGEICENGGCVTGCRDDSTCPAEQECGTKPGCVSGRQCSTASGCVGGPCVNGECECIPHCLSLECAVNSDCPYGTVCEQDRHLCERLACPLGGECLSEIGPGVECASDKYCKPTACTSSVDCPAGMSCGDRATCLPAS